MKTLVFGYGNDIERQFANCSIYSMKAGYEILGSYDNMPQVIERLSKRDIDMVLMEDGIRAEYNNNELEMLNETFARYGAKAGIVK